MATKNARPFHCPHSAGEIVSVTLVLGGARSGKSRFAESLCMAPRTYIATAQAIDDEMKARIAKHREDRGPDWQTVEAPLELATAISAAN